MALLLRLVGCFNEATAELMQDQLNELRSTQDELATLRAEMVQLRAENTQLKKNFEETAARARQLDGKISRLNNEIEREGDVHASQARFERDYDVEMEGNSHVHGDDREGGSHHNSRSRSVDDAAQEDMTLGSDGAKNDSAGVTATACSSTTGGNPSLRPNGADGDRAEGNVAAASRSIRPSSILDSRRMDVGGGPADPNMPRGRTPSRREMETVLARRREGQKTISRGIALEPPQRWLDSNSLVTQSSITTAPLTQQIQDLLAKFGISLDRFAASRFSNDRREPSSIAPPNQEVPHVQPLPQQMPQQQAQAQAQAEPEPRTQPQQRSASQRPATASAPSGDASTAKISESVQPTAQGYYHSDPSHDSDYGMIEDRGDSGDDIDYEKDSSHQIRKDGGPYGDVIVFPHARKSRYVPSGQSNVLGDQRTDINDPTDEHLPRGKTFSRAGRAKNDTGGSNAVVVTGPSTPSGEGTAGHVAPSRPRPRPEDFPPLQEVPERTPTDAIHLSTNYYDRYIMDFRGR
ncbi:hypothetical protein CSOJ01_07389 [Colletotrichum sojae]|uniref:Uncharacterized protein n=1 Tax=Colletotrichum sojae TaxID=2175907 RepID=A0A8H6J991_9PEZI|nr:hypothetical protein CSOJ01_07389 [Colletotrichum sojae]